MSTDRYIKVLVIGESATKCQAIRDLPGGGYAVLEVHTATDGLRALRSEEVHCILLEGYAPDANILTLLDQLSATQTPVIILMEGDRMAAAVEAMKQGAHDCLVTASLTSHALRQSIHEAVKRQRVRREKEGYYTRLESHSEELERQILEHRRSDEALRKSEAKYRTLLESLPQFIWHKNRASEYVSCNKNYAHALGLSANQIAGRTDFDLYDDKLAKKYRNDDQRIMGSGATEDYEETWIEGGEERAVRTIKIPLKDEQGHVYGTLGIAEDITERRQAAVALRERDSRLREAQQLARLGYWYWDVSTGTVEWSDEVYKIFRRDPENFTPQIDSILALSPWPEDHQRGNELIQKAIESHEQGSYEQRFLFPDGSTGYYVSTFRGIYDDDGNLTAIRGTVQDITERKQAEAEVCRLNRTLERRVAERTRDLIAANENLAAFSSSVSHDLRASLRRIGSFASLIAECHGNRLDDDGLDLLQRMIGGVHEMNALIQGLLTLSRATSGSLDTQSIDISEIVLQLLDRHIQEASERSVGLEIQDNVEARGDPRLVKTLLANLIGNAWKYTGKTKTPRIAFGRTESRGRSCLFVQDNGAGFDALQARHLFQPFSRYHGSEEFEGTGIGLATAKRIVDRHGGDIWLSSRPGEGTTVYFTLGA